MLEYERALLNRSDHFESFLNTQAKEHREDMEKLYARISSTFTVAVTGFGLLVTFVAAASSALVSYHNRRDVKTVKEEIAAKFRTEINEEVKKETVSLQNRLNDLDAAINAQINLTKQATEKDFHLVAEYASVISHAAVVLNFPPTTDLQVEKQYNEERGQVIARLKSLQGQVRHHRTFNIFLARLHRARGELTVAIDELSEVIRSRKGARLDTGADHAALLYNRACYNTLRAQEKYAQGMTDDAQRYSAEAWADLKVWKELAPSEIDEAKRDDDLRWLVGNHSFRRNWDDL